MSVLPVGIGSSGGYTIDRSVRLRSSASAYLSHAAPASVTSNHTWTYSAWVKRGALGTTNYLLSAGNSSYRTAFCINSSDQLQFFHYSGTYPFLMNTNAVFRDPSAWYHIVFAFDDTQATNSNGCKVYVNGVQQTLSFTSYTQNNGTTINNTGYPTWIGWLTTTSNYLDGYLTEINFVDGQALTPSDFGEYDADSGVWKPKKYVGTYGTNGFYLNFSDNTSTTTLGYDYSGNGNNWTANNISLTSGVTYDSMTDVPTLTSETAGNYAVVNPIPPSSSGGSWFTQNGNLSLVRNGSGWITGVATIGVTSGKWYWEVIPQNSGGQFTIGIAKDGYDWTTYLGSNAFGWSYEGGAGVKYTNGSSSAYGATYTTNDVIGVAFDADAGTLTFYKNGASQGQAFSGLTSGPYYPACGVSNLNTTAVFNFGQRPFAYTPPTGFKALNTFNLPDSTIVDGSQYFDATTYTGTGATQSIVNSGGMQPDFVWTKARSSAIAGLMFDSVRGATKYLQTNSTAAEGTGSDSLTAFASNGFTVGADTSTTGVNQNTTTYVGWQWKAGGTAVSNTDGSITSSVSANTTSGFSVVTCTTPASGAFTIGHGLGVAPSMYIVKRRSVTSSWGVWHQGLSGGTYLALLESTSAQVNDATVFTASPTSTVLNIGSAWTAYGAQTMVAYCFAEVPGFSKFGKYTGNGSSTDGPFVFCGFRPRWIMVKRASSGAGTANWVVLDTSRDTYNLAGQSLEPNLPNAEYTPASSGYPMDILSNGFKQRGASVSQNESGSTYIYAAFAENPFKNSLAR